MNDWKAEEVICEAIEELGLAAGFDPDRDGPDFKNPIRNRLQNALIQAHFRDPHFCRGPGMFRENYDDDVFPIVYDVALNFAERSKDTARTSAAMLQIVAIEEWFFSRRRLHPDIGINGYRRDKTAPPPDPAVIEALMLSLKNLRLV